MEVGSKVKLQTADGQFGGIVLAMNRQQQYVTLCHGQSYLVISCTSVLNKRSWIYL